jgi:hypothetical protein
MKKLFAPLSVLALFSLVFNGCTSNEKVPDLLFESDRGVVAWDSTGSAGIYQGSYLDEVDTLQSLVADSDSAGRLELVSEPLVVQPGRPISFAYAVRTEDGSGELASVSLLLLDDSLRTIGDTLLHAIKGPSGENVEGDTRGWIEYTRSIMIPGPAVAVKVRLLSEPTKGRVSIGRCRFGRDEGWLAYAATFSSHLGRRPEDRYLFAAGRLISARGTSQPGPAEGAAGMLLFERKALVDATPYANPREEDRMGVLYERVPRGTVAPLVFGVKALVNLAGVRVSLSGPPSGAEGVLRARSVLYQARYAATRLEGSSSRVFGVRTRMLESPSPMSLPSGENLFYWLDVPVPENTRPGIYKGRLSVQAEGRAALEVPYRIEVLDIALPPLPDSAVVGFYYYPPDDARVMEAQFRDMAAHGINAVSLSGSFITLSEAGSLRIDWDRVMKLDRVMALMRRFGMKRPTSLYVADIYEKLKLPRDASAWTEEHDRKFTTAIRLMNNTAINRGWSRLMFFPVDEPANDPGHMALARRTLGLLKEMDGIITLCDLNTPSSVEELSPYLDAVVIQVSSVSQRTVELTAGRGLSTFFYLPSFGSYDTGHDSAFHRVIPGWFLPRNGTRGIYYFAYQLTEGDPCDELDGSHRDWCAAYPPASGQSMLRPSPEYQGIRRGIEDLRLVYLVRSLAARCQGSGDEALAQRGRAATAKLAAILERVEPSGPAVIQQIHHRLDTYAAESWRRELLDEAGGMQRALQGK